MYDELIKSIHCCFGFEEPAVTDCENCMMKDKREEHNYVGCCDALWLAAAEAIEELSAKVDRLQFFVDNISKLPDCNTCLKKNLCEFAPKYGEYCRINCPAWLGKPPKEE